METNVLKDIIEGDYCSGCGVCAAIDNRYEMSLDDKGRYKAEYKENREASYPVEKICPFSNASKNETELGEMIFKNQNDSQYDENIGYYLNNYIGNVSNDDARLAGSSGGIGSWILTKLLDENMVDGIIHVTDSKDMMYEYSASLTKDEVRKGAKSKYYPIELSKVIPFIKNTDMTFAVVGVPCFIKAIKSAQLYDEELNNRIKYTVGLVCGHLKSQFFSKSISWEAGINPKELERVDFRKKLEGRKASDYGVEITSEKSIVIKPTRELSTTNWGLGYFKYNACDFCDDVLAETADITIGDAWLPEYEQNYLGTNIVVVRNKEIAELFKNNDNELELKEATTKEIIVSQAAGFRHRKEGLKYRLFLKNEQNVWVPEKRVSASNEGLDKKRKLIYEYRTTLTEQSFVAYKKAVEDDNFDSFREHMKPYEKEYNKLNGNTFTRKVLRKMKKIIIK